MELIMENDINIAIFGAPVNNGNLGCQALTYSIISLLNEVEKKNILNFHYYDFEGLPDKTKTVQFCQRLGIASNKMDSVYEGNYHDILRRIKHFKDNKEMQNALKQCALAIDLTQGDSFADIYGDYRFASWTANKELVEKLNIPLILGSQTYGPFNKTENEKRAAEVIKKASAVFTRDKISADYVKKISGINSFLTCDLAFRLPYKKNEGSEHPTCKKVGFNISGLLISNGEEGADTDKGFNLATNYDQFADKVLTYLLDHNYEVHLIGHVEADYSVNKEFKGCYPQVILAPEFDNPMDAKSYISNMDLFIGSRMHATIAALTSDTPVIPVAYSRKFTGLFDNVNYPYVVDLQKLSTDDSVNAVINRIQHYEETRDATAASYAIAMNENEECYKAYEKVILNLVK